MRLIAISIAAALILTSTTWASRISASTCTYQITSITRDYYQYIHIKGFVTNTGATPVKFVDVNAAGYNDRHDMIDSSSSYAVAGTPLKPGERAFFDVTLQDRDGNEITQYEVNLD
jgi:hypothetical protein